MTSMRGRVVKKIVSNDAESDGRPRPSGKIAAGVVAEVAEVAPRGGSRGKKKVRRGRSPIADRKLASILDDVSEFLARFVVFPSEQARHATALWVAHAHLIDAAESTPRLALLSPEKQSGKSRVLELVALLVPGPMLTANSSIAALFRRVGNEPTTVLMDECDTYLGHTANPRYEELRGWVNSGHRRGVPTYRCSGPGHEVVEFHGFAPVALAGIGNLPETILDRSIEIKMQRRAPGESIEKFRRREVEPVAENLNQRLADWADNYLERVLDATPEMPAELADRTADVWEPILAIAAVAGPEWSDRGTKAAMVLSEQQREDSMSLGQQLLLDIRTIFDNTRTDKMSSKSLVSELRELPESPWDERSLTERALSSLLKPYGPRPKTIRVGNRSPRGYERSSFVDAWRRYLPDADPSGAATSTTSATPARRRLPRRTEP